MDLTALFVVLILAGLIGWVLTRTPPEEPLRTILVIILVILLILSVSQYLGLAP